ncbi:MAG: translation initiation factor [Limnoraphis robusta]|uniref:SUI1 domain-containing protein n=1 Tax=Limnoraphis robusta CS-951 TaxID=1637645 RepID=A0A0F5YDN5_9CYAN|nr:translation initiation factor [Limnoraphis robusta]KKD36986.1 hypothetical protein WN50_16875 [Limnoraphis robusta CS-951]MEA5495646.1 translation initiation factor [Limnoraphis robusta BA-68 BA1]MEA5538766.1 translation initiation factor [Limnoraphis robusta Tam1]
MASKQNSNSAQNSSKNRVIYSEFGQNTDSAALERAKPDLPPAQQNLKIEASRKGRKGKTVTVISGFQTSNETLEKLVKQLKTHCGSGGTLKEDTIEIQGDHAQKLLEMLTKLGYKAKISGR